jgi:hypothetical protein
LIAGPAARGASGKTAESSSALRITNDPAGPAYVACFGEFVTKPTVFTRTLTLGVAHTPSWNVVPGGQDAGSAVSHPASKQLNKRIERKDMEPVPV